MTVSANLNRHVIDALYAEALDLADEARDAFDLSTHSTHAGEDEDLARIALSCEALRTTTRMMHIIAWLLNHRAYFDGELTEAQLRRNGRLSGRGREADSIQLELLSPAIRDLIERTWRFHERVERLDHDWAESELVRSNTVRQLRNRLDDAVGSL